MRTTIRRSSRMRQAPLPRGDFIKLTDPKTQGLYAEVPEKKLLDLLLLKPKKHTHKIQVSVNENNRGLKRIKRTIVFGDDDEHMQISPTYYDREGTQMVVPPVEDIEEDYFVYKTPPHYNKKLILSSPPPVIRTNLSSKFSHDDDDELTKDFGFLLNLSSKDLSSEFNGLGPITDDDLNDVYELFHTHINND